MNRRQFALALPVAMAGCRLGWAAPGAEPGEATAPLSLAFRSGPGEPRCGDAYQIQLRETVAALRSVGHVLHAGEFETDVASVKGRLTGTCRLSIGFFPPAFAPLLADWLRSSPDRYVTVALGDVRTTACRPEEALRIAHSLEPGEAACHLN